MFGPKTRFILFKIYKINIIVILGMLTCESIKGQCNIDYGFLFKIICPCADGVRNGSARVDTVEKIT